MKYKDHEVSVYVENSALQEYGTEMDEGSQQTTCWIASEASKAFTINWRVSKAPGVDTACEFTVDGQAIIVGLRPQGKMGIVQSSGHRTGPTTLRPFVFSTLLTTDDDDYLHDSRTKDIGEIKAVIWEVALMGHHNYQYKDIKDLQVHERAKKAMDHKVGFGESQPTESPVVFGARRTRRLAEFIFKYRSLDFLRAQGISPPPSAPLFDQVPAKRKATEDDHEQEPEGEPRTGNLKREDSPDQQRQDEDEARLKALLAETEALRAKLARQGKSTQQGANKRVKTEPSPSKLAEPDFIDLTGDD